MSVPDVHSARAVTNWQLWWPEHALEAREDVRLRLSAAVAAWELEDVRALGDGEVAVVVSARSRGRDVVVKLNPRVTGHTELDREAAGLAFWAATGAVVEPLDCRDDDATMLLTRLRPGVPLRYARLSESAMLSELGALAARLHAAGRPPANTFLQLRESSLGRDIAAPLASEREADELGDLLRPDDDDVLIHADLHTLNALRADAEFKAIDPKPHLGDRHADIFEFILDPFLELPDGRRAARALTTERITRYANAAKLDIERAQAWTRILARSFEQRLTANAGAAHWELVWAHRMRRLAAALR